MIWCLILNWCIMKLFSIFWQTTSQIFADKSHFDRQSIDLTWFLMSLALHSMLKYKSKWNRWSKSKRWFVHEIHSHEVYSIYMLTSMCVYYEIYKQTKSMFRFMMKFTFQTKYQEYSTWWQIICRIRIRQLMSKFRGKENIICIFLLYLLQMKPNMMDIVQLPLVQMVIFLVRKIPKN